MVAIETHELTKRYKDVTAVEQLNLAVKEGELFALLGVNGAGKTTTIKMLTCLTRPTDGDAFIEGKSITGDLAGIKRMIAVSPQETAVAPNLTVRENLALMAGVHSLTGEAARIRMEAMIGQFDLAPIAGKQAGKLSGGWQRRLSIAMALISQPKILFLDEPTLGLDVLARSELWDTIRSLKGKVTIVLTTHYMEEAETLADRVGIMKRGRLLTVGTVEEVKAQAGADRLDEAFVRLVKEGDQ